MYKQSQAFTFLQTTGAGIAIGTNVDFGGFIRGSDLAGTITLAASGFSFVASAASSVILAAPIALNGTLTMTSSAGKDFIVIYRQR